MDRVIVNNIVFAHIPGRANAVADFLSRMQTDPSQSLELQLLDSIPMKQIDIDRKAKTPDASMLSLESSSILNETKQPPIPPDLMAQLQANDVLPNLFPNLNANLESASPRETIELFALKQAPELHSIQADDLLSIFDSSNTNTQVIDIQTEQKKDPVLRKVMTWVQKGCTGDITYASFELKNYHKQLSRLHLQKGIVTREVFNDVGKISEYQVCIPKHLRQEVIYRIHNSPTGGHVGIVRTAQEFRKRFYFPGFTEFLADYIKNCLSCSTLERVNKKQLNPPLQPISSEQLFPGDMMPIDLVGPFQSPICKYALSGIDVFSKYLFAVPLTSAHAGNVAKAFVSLFFQNSYLRTTLLSDLGTCFVAKLQHELTDLLEFHASLKHPQTIGVAERSHSALKRILKLNTDESWSHVHP